MSEHFAGDVGTEVIVNTFVDISTATVTELLVTKPTGATVTWTASIYNTTFLKYIIQANDWTESEIGEWVVQAYVETPSWKGYGEEAKFTLSKPRFQHTP